LRAHLSPFLRPSRTGKGQGSGLSQVYGFVGESKDHITLVSEPGAETSVKIYLPRLVGAEEIAVRAPVLTELPSMHATVLVFEDDGDVRAYIVSALTQLGYDLQAGEAPAALSVIECHPEVDVLLTDVGLPESMPDNLRMRQAAAMPASRSYYYLSAPSPIVERPCRRSLARRWPTRLSVDGKRPNWQISGCAFLQLTRRRVLVHAAAPIAAVLPPTSKRKRAGSTQINYTSVVP
jgi:hypothetical protein